MKILSFETSNNFASVAIKIGQNIVVYKITEKPAEQAEKLFKLIATCLEQANLTLEQIDLITLSNGPGSFTGVRIGLAAALGIEFGFKGQIICLSNLQVVAYQAKVLNQKNLVNYISILDARREQAYLQIFDQDLNAVTDPKLINIANFAAEIEKDRNYVVAGNAALLVNLPKNCFIDSNLIKEPTAEDVILASEYFYQQKLHYPLIPLYIRDPDASIKN